jgi:hypothetical protein
MKKLSVSGRNLELAERYLCHNDIKYTVIKLDPNSHTSRVPLYEIIIPDDEDALLFEILGGEPEFHDNLIRWWES